MDDLTPQQQAQLAAIATTYPGWHIVVHHGWWWATKHSPPTAEQKAAGVLPQFARPGPHEMVAALNVQLGILARMGAA
ncbi:hypothetical protein C1I98_26195 [Spongiactinospora gelatinilytica]|uniref:Uncharacterized protein n=1 Tax=Spongiactinospora gelatinilytica TaxID=2666298 RepID=A0A2W2GRL0_9ACTN|nr:hypothetical protein [Spongiactinospora gelatinilytica]PZG36827.1 hypothetical protein C1I98_26195 [Spongiactinospora gelatinilytica]